MELLNQLIDFVLHIDAHLNELIVAYGMWTYAILFVIVFLETGFVVTPFLPGDSLLFAAGTFAALGSLDPMWLIVLLSIAAIAGDTVNYWVGWYVGPKVFHDGKRRFFKREYLDRTHRFYEAHGGATIIIARFVPIIRTFAPFVAGIGRMSYWKFVSYNVVGGIVWVTGFVLAGYYFGNIPAVRRNFTLVIAAIIIVSTLPPIVEFVRHRIRSAKSEPSG